MQLRFLLYGIPSMIEALYRWQNEMVAKCEFFSRKSANVYRFNASASFSVDKKRLAPKNPGPRQHSNTRTPNGIDLRPKRMQATPTWKMKTAATDMNVGACLVGSPQHSRASASLTAWRLPRLVDTSSRSSLASRRVVQPQQQLAKTTTVAASRFKNHSSLRRRHRRTTLFADGQNANQVFTTTCHPRGDNRRRANWRRLGSILRDFCVKIEFIVCQAQVLPTVALIAAPIHCLRARRPVSVVALQDVRRDIGEGRLRNSPCSNRVKQILSRAKAWLSQVNGQCNSDTNERSAEQKLH